jgi:hypothetical protein
MDGWIDGWVDSRVVDHRVEIDADTGHEDRVRS